MAYQDHIVSDPEICNGRLTIKGTRVPVRAVMEFLICEERPEDIIKAMPSLTYEDVRAVIAYVASVTLRRMRRSGEEEEPCEGTEEPSLAEATKPDPAVP